MTRRVFFSFHYQADNSRVQQIKNMGAVEHQKTMNSNEWETLKRNGDLSIKRWINKSMENTSCTVVLIGENTYSRKWVQYEITRSIEIGKPIFGIYINNLKDFFRKTSPKGLNPFKVLGLNNIDAYDVPSINSYNYIKEHFNEWVEKAINK